MRASVRARTFPGVQRPTSARVLAWEVVKSDFGHFEETLEDEKQILCIRRRRCVVEISSLE
jgi:hypothetical protein